jgi:LAO/AO transport system kinase
VAGFDRALSGDRRALSRALSSIEDRVPGSLDAVAALRPRRATAPGVPHVIGLTGPPGAGKSTFANRLVADARGRGLQVAVLAVDPSSPFTGGAILGDRIRLEEHASDPMVFVRSVASRGHLGGLSRATGQMVDLLDCFGVDLVLVETVGVGQSELGVMEVADTVIVVLTPESGDTVQTMKAGLLEIADIFVVNKRDRPGAEHLRRELEAAVELDSGEGWRPPVFTTAATLGEGMDAVTVAAREHLAACVGPQRAWWEARRAAGRVRTYLDLIGEDAREKARKALFRDDRALHAALLSGAISPYAAAAEKG